MKNVLVTGAAGGMGLEVCKRLRDDGYRVFGLDKTDFLCEGVEKILCDITSEYEVAEAIDKIRECTHELYAVVHTAGIYDLDSLVEMDEVRFRRIFDINLFGVYRINKLALPLLSSGSRIIITTSELAPLDPLPFTGIYGITKTALEKYAFSLRMELNLLGIGVSVIRPGAVKTKLLSASTDALDRFCEGTENYKCNAERFRKIVDSVESRSISPERIASLISSALSAKRLRLVYNINRNRLLRLLCILPDRLQIWIIKQILKSKKEI